MNGNLLRSQGLLAIAVGAGVVIGAAGVFLYEHFFKEKRRLILQKDVTKLGLSVSELKRELQELRDAQKRLRRSRTKSLPSAPADAESDALSGADDDDEFYDLSDEDDVPESNDVKDTSETPFKEIDRLLSGSAEDKSKCLGDLLELNDKNKDDPEVLWRLAKCCHGLSSVKEAEGDLERKQDYINKGLEYATRCLELAPRSSDAHKWFAICIGARSENQGVKDKLKDGLEFKEHVEEALTLKPSDPTLHHLLGRFLFEVASLSWVERKVATTLFGEVPYASYSEALESLIRSEELIEAPWKENRLLIAKCYIQMGEYSQALEWLDKAEEVEPISKEDRKAEAEIANLKNKYQHHRGLI